MSKDALAASDPRRSAWVAANAGAGKTHTLANRVTRLLLAGAFGNYIRIESARRIGLAPGWAGDVKAEGNTALRGTRMLLLSPSRRSGILDRLLSLTRHIELAAMPEFQDAFVQRMALG